MERYKPRLARPPAVFAIFGGEIPRTPQRALPGNTARCERYMTQRLRVRVSPKASRNSVIEAVVEGERLFKVAVTTVPEGGKATADVVKLLAKHLGVAKSRLVLISGAKSRDKVFELRN